ncbi:hypothetical protein WBJ53_02825 [Spirosoma sp. SC4-14]|uniref:hypothetical protein n=1 Tax=Spirosoma sp. SC4-14 TaxID=3128900 RepID=UPI0030CE0756
MKRDDTLWKAILEDVFDDFLRFFVPQADSLFVFNRPFSFPCSHARPRLQLRTSWFSLMETDDFILPIIGSLVLRLLMHSTPTKYWTSLTSPFISFQKLLRLTR